MVDMTAQSLAGALRGDGFAVVDCLIASGEVDALASAYDEIVDGRKRAAGDRMLGGITRQVMNPSAAHALFEDNMALRNAKALVSQYLGGSDIVRTFDMLITKPPGHPYETPWHQDLAYADLPFAAPGTTSDGETVQVWVALDDVDVDNGCMQFAHQDDGTALVEHFVASGEPSDPGRLLAMAEFEKKLDLKNVVSATISRGGCTMHLSTTPHYTGSNKTPDRQRRAYIFNLKAS